jgi:hypothetical protein
VAGHRWSLLLQPKWLCWHAFALLATAGMVWLGDWQLHRALSGNELSWAYTVEWPLFAAFGLYFWARTMRDEMREVSPGRPAGAAAADGGAPGSAGTPAEPEASEEYAARLRAEVRGHGKWHGLR